MTNSKWVLSFKWIVVLLFLFLNNLDLLNLWRVQDLDPAQRTIHQLKIFRDPDEAWYGVVLDHLKTKGCDSVPVSYLYQDRPNFHSCYFLKSMARLAPDMGTPVLVWWIKFITRNLFVVLVAVLIAQLRISFWFGMMVGLLLSADNGVIVIKPLIASWQAIMAGTIDDFTRTHRLISPSLYWIPMLLSLLLWTSLLLELQKTQSVPKGKWWLTGLGVLIMAFVPFYAWVPWFWAMGSIWFLAFIGGGKFSLTFSARIVLIPVLAALSFALYNLKKAFVPGLEEVLPRSGFFKDAFAPLFVSYKALILGCIFFGVLLCIWCWRNRRLGPLTGFLVLLIASGPYLIQNVNVFTGLDYQNHHFRDYLGPFLVGSIFVLAWDQVNRIGRVIVTLFLVLSVSVSLVQLVRSQYSAPDSPHRMATGFDSEGVNVLKSFFAEKQVEAHCGPYLASLPIVSKVVCSYHHLLMTYPLSHEELMKVAMAHYRLLGVSDEEVYISIFRDADPNRGMALWSQGGRREWFAGKNSVEMLEQKFLADEVIPMWMEEYRNFDVAAALDAIQSPPYVVAGAALENQLSHFGYQIALRFRDHQSRNWILWQRQERTQ